MVSRSGFQIGPHRIGGEQCFVIAEAGVNHNGDLDRAHALIEAAVAAGADAVKFQTFRADLVTARGAPKASYQMATTDAAESQLEMLRGLELGAEAFAGLQAHCRERGITFLSTPFDLDSLALLVRLDVPAIKIPSGEVTNPLLIAPIARCGKPVILSTGMCTLAEVADAVALLEREGCPGLALLHCVSNYPAESADANLRAMRTMKEAFGWPVGYSDHTSGCDIAWAATALGACVLEKHFTLDKTLPGPDHRASLDTEELKQLVRGVRRVESALGDGVKAPRPSEENTREVARRSLFLRAPLAVGEPVTETSLVAKRPAGGISPARIAEVLGRSAARPLREGSMLAWADLA